MKLPCIATKCIKYPACKSKQIIDCTLLNDYHFVKLDELKPKLGYAKAVDANWVHIHKFFPHVTSIRQDDNRFMRY